MFTKYEKKQLEDPYFIILSKNPDYYELQSCNTKHCWIIQKPCNDGNIHTKHKYRKYVKHYHDQCNSASVKSAIKKIKQHDTYMLLQTHY